MNDVRKQLLIRLKRVLIAGFDAPLKSVGYRKKGFRYDRLVTSGLRHLIQVTRTPYPKPDETKFTADCGAYLEAVWLFYPNRFDVGNPYVSCCVVQERIGFLGGEELDTWWTIKLSDGESTLDGLAQELRLRIVEQVLPWLARFDSARAIGDYLIAPEKAPGRIRLPYREIVQDAADLRNAALAYFAAGDNDRARTMLDLASKTIGTPASKNATAGLRERMEQLIAMRKSGQVSP